MPLQHQTKLYEVWLRFSSVHYDLPWYSEVKKQQRDLEHLHGFCPEWWLAKSLYVTEAATPDSAMAWYRAFVRWLYGDLGYMETLEFIIYPDGRVVEKVTGIMGNSCTEVTAAIEAQLGHVVNRENSAEYFAQESYQSSAATTQTTAYEW